ncbi:MAG: hypothetical protein NUV34_04185 [Sulfuricaulis sp.]|nr:hypothetical protein [Sulfuricaulis sp.]
MTDDTKFDSWAVVELFGHQQLAGRVVEATIAGGAFLRVDVPDQPAIEAEGFYGARPAVPAYSRIFGTGAIYCINPCSEAAARQVAARLRARPPIPIDVAPASLALPYDDEPENC